MLLLSISPHPFQQPECDRPLRQSNPRNSFSIWLPRVHPSVHARTNEFTCTAHENDGLPSIWPGIDDQSRSSPSSSSSELDRLRQLSTRPMRGSLITELARATPSSALHTVAPSSCDASPLLLRARRKLLPVNGTTGCAAGFASSPVPGTRRRLSSGPGDKARFR